MSRQKQTAKLHIDRLVLRGFSHSDAQRVRDAFTTTLQQGFSKDATDGAPISARQEAHRCLAPLTASNPHTIGRLAAEALLESLHDE